jgi:DNA segregation ATPase FtsK/SpoIIIE, S-DNA-T family
VELRLVVESGGQPARDVAVDARPQHTAAELLAALARHLGLDHRQPLQLQCRRSGAWLLPAQELGSADLRWGDRLLIARGAAPARAERDAVVDLVVLGGPAAGMRQPLSPGQHRVGSTRYSSVVVEDPSVSGVHLLVTVAPGGDVTVQDQGSDSGTWVESGRVAAATPVRPGQVVHLASTLLAFETTGGRQPPSVQESEPDGTGRIPFNRQPRVTAPPAAARFDLGDAPARESTNHLPISYAVVPTLFAVVLVVVYRNLLFVLFALLTPVMAIVSIAEIGIPQSMSYRRAVRRFRARLQELDREVAVAHEAEASRARAAAPDAPTLLGWAKRLDPRLWERRPDDEDWLSLRLGWCDRVVPPPFRVPERGTPALVEEAFAIQRRHELLPRVPMTVSLARARVLGLAGDRQPIAALARWLLVQLAALQSPEDLVLAAAIPAPARAEWAWLGWLPHVRSETSPLPEPLIAADRIAARGLLDRLLALVAQRRAAAEAGHDQPGPAVVALLHEEVELPRGAVTALLEQGPDVGVHAIWLSASAQRLPGQCGAVVEVRPGSVEPRLTLPGTGESSVGGGVDGVSQEFATEAALALAPIRDVGARSRQAGIPRQINLVEMLGLQDGLEARMLQQWVRERSTPEDRTLSAAWGAMDGGELFHVSLRLDGPHGLVGGTTGSGKSELLQSLFASLAAAHSPRTLNFLLVDYKGGAAFKDCVDLPHTVGFVTDLDGHLVSRALVSLRAELRRREEILRRTGAKDLMGLERRAPDLAPPSLLIVVDEFAALASELPDFVDGMVDIAQRGRSLGIHLVLATQRPAGVIGSKIRANTNLRVALRFSDEAESEDVVGTREAARPGLPPGRAFARVGPSPPVEFQAGYVGGRTSPGSRGPAPLTVVDLVMGLPPAEEADRARAEPVSGETDLQRLVRAAVEVNRRLGLPPPRRPWVPPLPDVLPLDALPEPRRAPGGGPRAVLGLLDDPGDQRQTPIEFGIDEDGAMLVFGSSGSGKTTALRSLAVSLALAVPSDQLHVYALDFATRGLKPLELLPQCGAVIAGDEPERAVRLLAMLQAEAERRKALLAASGAGTLAEYLRARPDERLPRILVLLDGYTGFQTAMNDAPGSPGEVVRTLVAEGRPLGIAWLVASDRYSPGVGLLASLVRRRLVLRQASDDEYQVLGVPRSLYRDAHLPPGRGFTEDRHEVQCAIVGDDPSGSGQAAAVAEVAARLRLEPAAVPAPEVRLLPNDVARASLPRPRAALEAIVGLDDEGLRPASVDLGDGHLIVAGPRGSGRTSALATFAASLDEAPGGPSLHLFAGSSHSRLTALDVWTTISVGPEACMEAATRIAEAVRTSPSTGLAVIVIDDGEELPADHADLEWLVQRGREIGVRVLVGIENRAAQRMYSGWLPLVTKDRHGLLLDPDTSLDSSLVGNVRLPSRQGSAWPPGRAFLVRRGAVRLVQVAIEEAQRLSVRWP